MKKSLIFTLLLCASATVFAQQRSATEMLSIANSYFNKISGSSSAKSTVMTPAKSLKLSAMSSSLTKTATAANEAFAVYAAEDGKGYVIVSVNEKMPEVLASSTDGCLRTKNNPALQGLLENYAVASELIAAGKATSDEIFGSTKNILTADDEVIVEPILGDIKFDQSPVYNNLCPMVRDSLCVTGCVQTAMAQIMKYYQFPDVGKGEVNYTTTTEKVKMSFNLEDYPFDWANMLDTYYGEYDPTKNIKIYDDAAIYIGEDGYVSTDKGFPTMLCIYNLNKYSFINDPGYVQFVIYNKDKSIARHASYATYSNDYYFDQYFSMSLPADIPDGTYYISPAFSTDSVTYMLANKSENSYDAYSIPVKKVGNEYTILDETFLAAANHTQATAVASLMLACGGAAQADYGPQETSAVTSDATKAMHDNFGYDKDMYFINNTIAKTDKICSVAKEELEKKHVIMVSGAPENNPTGGHCYLIDGYEMTEANPKFHINWGWSGGSNDYFLITNMKPSAAGTGGVKENYSYSYALYLNIIPNNNIEEKSAMGATSSTVSQDIVTPGTVMKVTFKNLTNMNVVKNAVGNYYFYLVNSAGTAYKADSYDCIPNDDPLEPGTIYTEPEVLKVTIPNTVPNGRYHFELRKNSEDVFFCKSQATIQVTESFYDGDVNMDGNVDINDVNAIIDAICGNDSEFQTDVNGDGNTDINDVNTVIDIICGNE